MAKYELLKEIEQLREMAVSRKEWKAKVEASLMGAFGEYMSGRIAEDFHLHNAWVKETKRLVKVVNDLFTKNITFKNMRKAFNEVIAECTPDFKVNYAKHHVIDYYPHLHRQIMEHDIDGDQEFVEFLRTFIDVPE